MNVISTYRQVNRTAKLAFLLSFLITFMSSINTFCQDSTKFHAMRILVGLGSTPIWNYLQNKSQNFNASSGVLTSINFDNILEMRTGILMDAKQYSVYEYDIYSYYPTPGKSGEKTNSFKYFRIPTTINIHFFKTDQVFLFSSLGFIFGIPNFKTEKKYSSVDYSGRQNILIHGSLGLKYYLSEKLHISVEPFYNRFSSPIVEKVHYRASIGAATFGNARDFDHYIESINSRNIFGTIFSINYNYIITSKR